ncbi:MAG: multicomponent Na+:H+ antiporter subunit [Archaeoglobi archaeon]|nr:multicomponent Na+:H+ antiporter subunit [Archaeoglobi archaeon]MDK2781061.1 multicomponent Na+:H+ antiporter subunit [Archaeoglobi archaeon]
MIEGYLPYIFAISLFALGLGTVIWKNNLIKILIGLDIMESAVHLFLVSLGYRTGGTAPIWTGISSEETVFVLPIPQALTLTSIVIGLATLAMALSITVNVYRHYGTLDIREIRRLRG